MSGAGEESSAAAMAEGDGYERDYDVGYGKPPSQHRFKPGQSGNPRGRPKKSKSLAAIMAAELNRKVTLKVNGKPIKATMSEVIVKQAVKKAAESGDLRQLTALSKLVAAQGVDRATDPAVAPRFDEEDDRLLANYIAEIRKGEKS